MNGVIVKCWKCGKTTMVSQDELMMFKRGVCLSCDTKEARFIRHKAVYGFYDLKEIKAETVDKMMEKELECRKIQNQKEQVKS